MFVKQTIQRMKNRKKAMTIMLLALFLSVFFMSSISLYRDNQTRYETELNYQRYGKWQVMMREVPNVEEFDQVGTMYLLNAIEGIQTGSFDQKMFELSKIELMEGRYPENHNEIMIDTVTLDTLHKPFQCNQKLKLNIDGKNKEYTVVGIMLPYTMNWIQSTHAVYPSIITTQLKSDNSFCYIYDKKINEDTINDYHFDLINSFSYPHLEFAFKDKVTESNPIDVMDVFDMIAFVAGFVVVGTVFFQQLLKRKKMMHSLCMLGIRESVMMKEALWEGLLLCGIVTPMAVILSILGIYGIFVWMSSIPVSSFFHINLIEILLKTILLVICVLVLFLLFTKIVLLSWDKEIRGKKEKHKQRNVKMQIGIPLFLLIFSVLAVFSTYDVYEKYIVYQREESLMNSEADYSYQDISCTELDYLEIKEKQFEGYGKTKAEIKQIENVYGIDSVEYGYIIPRVFEDGMEEDLYDLHTLNNSREELSEKGITFSDKEYQQFLKGESTVLVFSDIYGFTEETRRMFDQYYEQGNTEINKTVYMNIEGKKQPVLISSVKFFKSSIHESYADSGGILLCSNAFVEKYFDVNEGPYQHISVNANKSADYAITDKQMSMMGLENHRLEASYRVKQTKTIFITALILTVLIYLIMITVFINIWNGYLYTHKKEMGIMQTIGINDKYIVKKYWRKLVFCIVGSVVIAFLIKYGIEMYNEYQESLVNLVEKEERMRFMGYSNEFVLGMLFHKISIFIVSMIAILMGSSYFLLMHNLKGDAITKVNEE